MSDTRGATPKVAVVIPCYKVKRHILKVIAGIGPECCRIYAVDDCCPEHSGDFIEQNCHDPRVTVLRNAENLGVGGAVIHSYRAALDAGMDVVVKVDGDGQMDPALLPRFIAPLLAGEADYTKGNRFFDLEGLQTMPTLRLVGNSVLSLMNKLSSGYWDIFDPTNGYTAIHCEVLRRLPLHKLSRRYFFESDLLFRLNVARAVVQDVPMSAIYGDEVSNLKISQVAGEFLGKHLRNFSKRLFYNYYLRGMSLASIELPLGLALVLFGLIFGGTEWFFSARVGVRASTGTVMLSVLPLLMGVQFILAFLAYDIATVPRRVLPRPQRNAQS
jgi:glycosyltransferase involved in cell wall biosynthesis